jgi:glycosyltransferase involved in cell wall biosynthesis
MMTIMLVLFWFSALMIFYAYFGYPLILLLLSVFKSSTPTKTSAGHKPKVSFIITAYNEEARIEEKIKGALEQDYPKDRLEIIVASDCSTDRTDEIVKAYEREGVRLVRAPERKGKESAQKHAIEAAGGEILVFSDVATCLKPDGISSIIKNFADPFIGCVSSEDRFIDAEGNISGEGAYVRYEMFLRKLECKVNTVVGLSGSFFAARQEVCSNWATDLQSDFNTLLNSIKMGKKGISDPASLGYYKNIIDEKKEFNRKVRTVLRGITVLMCNLNMLNPFIYGLFSFQLFSHKLCRWLVPVFMLVAFFTNAYLIQYSSYYMVIIIIQISLYFAAFGYFLTTRADEFKSHNYLFRVFLQAGRIAFYFTSINASILVAWFKYFKAERATLWEPSKR